MNSRIKAETIDKMVVIYAACFTCWRTLMVIMPLGMAINHTPVGSLFKALFYAVGIGLLVVDYFRNKRVLSGANIVWLFALALSILLAECIHYQYADFSVLVKQCVRSAILVFLLYTAGMRMTKRAQMRFLLILHSILSVIFIPAIGYMFYQFFTLQHYVVNATNQGWYEGRLFGITTSPYAGAMIMAILGCGAVFLFCHSEGIVRKSVYFGELVIYIIYIVLSDTRTVYVACAMGMGFIVLWMCRKGYLSDGKKRRSFWIVRGVISFLLLTLVMFVMIKGIRTAGLYCAQKINEKSAQESFVEFSEEQDRPKGTTFTSRRAYIWRSYFEVLTEKPISLLFGLSLSGSSSYIRDNYPDTYIVNDFKYLYPESYEQGNVYATHNTYLTVLVYSGIIGLAFLLAFLIKCACSILRRKLSPFEAVLSAIIVMILTAGFFEAYPFFTLTDTACIFWLCAGFLMNAPEGERTLQNASNSILPS